MLGFAILFSWIGLAVCFIALGKLCECNALIGIGAVMVLMTAMVGKVTY